MNRPPAATYDANRYLLLGLLKKQNVQVTDLGILGDDPNGLRDTIAQAAQDHDVVLTSGGVSSGDADNTRKATEAIGHTVFWRVAIKPGKPVALGVIGEAIFIGLPGNPIAAYVTFATLVRPILRRLSGAAACPLPAFPVRSGFYHHKKSDRREYLRASLRTASDGHLEAIKFPKDGSAIISSLTETDGLVELSESLTRVEPGMLVDFLPFHALE
jgi:molybdopterin molybdotransferase